MLFYRAAVDLWRSTLNYVAGIIRHSKVIRSPWLGRLNRAQQALLVLVYLRKSETFTKLGAGSGVSAATAWRYVEETVDLLQARAPRCATRYEEPRGMACTTWCWTARYSTPTACAPIGRTTPPSIARME